MTIDLRITKAFEEQNGFPLEPHLVVLGLMGSHSHGTYLPPEEPNAIDDIDLMGFVVPPLRFHLGLERWQHWTFQFEELDVVLYSLEKAMRLLLKSNPNIVGLLWLRDDEYVHRGPGFELLQANRHIFSSLTAAETFMGYASDQLKRMEVFDAHFSGYMGEKRRAMVSKYQYDVKNASHLIRLLRMGAEFLESGHLNVYRSQDAEELKLIKRGGWTLDQVKAEAVRLFNGIEAAKARSPLPARPDDSAANDLLMRLHLQILGLKADA